MPALLADRALVDGIDYVFRRFHGIKVEAVPPDSCLEELVRRGIILPQRTAFTEAFGLALAYVCYEWRRQVFCPDAWGRYIERVDFRDKTVLDVGCGTGTTLRRCLDLGAKRCIGVDVNSASLDLGRILLAGEPRVAMRMGDGRTLAFENDVFDVVVCRVALNLMRADEMLSEMARVLRPGGVMFLVVHHAWYYFSMILTGKPKRMRYGAIILACDVARQILGRPTGGETFLTRRRLKRLAAHAHLRPREFWTPRTFDAYFGAILEKPADVSPDTMGGAAC